MGLTVCLACGGSFALAQVFPPRQPQALPSPDPIPGAPGRLPMQPAQVPQSGGSPGVLVKTIPFAELLGDPTKAFLQLGNMRSPMDTNFQFGRALAGRIAVEKFTHELGNGKPVFLHVNGLSNPPLVSMEGQELRLQFMIPVLLFKTYYQDYTGEGDGKLGDVTAEKVTVDVYFTPTIDQRKLPTYRTARVVVTGAVKEAEKCVYFFDMLFPVNVCNAAAAYLKDIKSDLENGLREALLHPQTRVRFEQALWLYLRGELLMHAGVNPAGPSQVQILEARFSGPDYVVGYVPR
ncbi:MAG: hypothetical protein OEV08_02290 [Nitrospira sp.]|nr:hypothetical protein [Nitrospira sp.]